MAIGLNPSFSLEIALEGLSQEGFLVIATEAIEKLKWNISATDLSMIRAYTKLSWSSYGEEINVVIDNGFATIKSSCTGMQLVDWGRNRKNVSALVSKIEELQTILTAEEIQAKIDALNLRRKEAGIAGEAGMGGDAGIDGEAVFPSRKTTGIQSVFSIFIPTEGYFITPILININILVFILMLVSGASILQPDNEVLLFWGANFRPYTLEGQWWRLFTACFVHIGIIHLLLNMYALLYIGMLLEPILGKTRFLAAYLLTGIGASLVSLWWNDFIISAGASGAIFGMYGVFLALLTTNLLEKTEKKTFLTSILVFIGYNLANGLKGNSGVDNAAHIGGLLSGLVIGYAFVPSLKSFENTKLKMSTIAILLVTISISGYALCTTLPNDIPRYEEAMKRFVTLEQMALEVYKLPESTSKEEILTEIDERGIYYWEECLDLLKSFENSNLPDAIKTRNHKLKQYCELRIKSYETIYKTIEEDTDKYQDQIKQYDQQVEKLIKEISGN